MSSRVCRHCGYKAETAGDEIDHLEFEHGEVITHKTFTARCRYLVERLHQQECVEPADQLPPRLFISMGDRPKEILEVPAPAVAMGDMKHEAFRIMAHALRLAGAIHVAHAAEAWMLLLDSESAIAKHWAAGGSAPPGQLPSERADRIEVVSLACFSSGEASMCEAGIVRSAGRPTLKAWVHRSVERGKYVGDLGEALATAVPPA